MSKFSCARNYIFCQIFEKVEGNIVGGKWEITLQFQINKVKISHKQKINYKYVYWNVSITMLQMYKITWTKIKPEMKILELLPFVLLPVIRGQNCNFLSVAFYPFFCLSDVFIYYVSGPITQKYIWIYIRYAVERRVYTYLLN